ncbi:MAG TPA: alpha/beta hydrolase [Acidimicrobiales bacterium]|nr:alpha/beta hydrolase [Acidimicrobiales bacterium]
MRVEEGVVVGSGGGRPLRADVFHPPGLEEPAPGVLLIHGGGWRSGDRSQLRGYGILLGRAGYVCVACEYRLVDESPWPAQIHDVKAALRWMRANADELHLDPDRVAVEGNSAGAHLALLSAGTAGLAELEGDGGNAGESTAVQAAIGFYTPTLFGHRTIGRGALPLLALVQADGSDEVARLASPLSHVGPDYPPTLLIHGAGDELVPLAASQVMHEALTEAGAPVELHVYAGQPHGFDADPVYGRRCADDMLFFLERYLRTRVTAGAPTGGSAAAL